MLIIPEAVARELVSVEDAIAAVETTFAAMARGAARNYPVVREVVGYQDAVYGVKAGCDRERAPSRAEGRRLLAAQCGARAHQPSVINRAVRSRDGTRERARQRELSHRRPDWRVERDRDQISVPQRQPDPRHHRRRRPSDVPAACNADGTADRDRPCLGSVGGQPRDVRRPRQRAGARLQAGNGTAGSRRRLPTSSSQ